MSPPPYTPMIHVNGGDYFPAPYSMNPLTHEFRMGLIPLGLVAVLSSGTTLTLICFICWRLVTWKLHYNTFLGYNQYVLLVLNLLTADLQQASAYLFSWHWFRFNRLLAPSAPCFAQGWLLHSGDVSSGFFVLAIAVHTYITAVHGKRIHHRLFTAMIVSIWAFAYALTGIGAALHGWEYFVRAGEWCWVSEAFETDRLMLHYVWVFLVQFGTVVIYVVTFFMLRYKTKRVFEQVRQGHTANMNTVLAVNRVAKLMTLYPCVYVLLTLPLSAGRMWSYSQGGKPYSLRYATFAGSMLGSCGWVDSLLYTLTRQRLLKETMPAGGARLSDLGMSGGITHTRTVTVEGGRPMDDLTPHFKFTAADAHELSKEPPPSPVNSTAPIIKKDRTFAKPRSVGLRAMVEEDWIGPMDADEERERSDELSALPVESPNMLSTGWCRHEC